MLTEKIKELRDQITEKQTDVNAKIDEAQAKASEGDLQGAKDLKAQIDSLKEEITKLQEDLKSLEELADLQPEQMQEDQKEIKEEGETRSMKKEKEILNPVKEEVRALEQYIRTKGEVRDGITTVNAQAVIPVDIITQPQEVPQNVLDLKKLANVVPVNTNSGTYPVLANPTAPLSTVEELAKNPELANLQFTSVDYKVATYRGAIPISQESLDDSDVDLSAIVSKHVKQYGLNTSNAKIAEVLKSFTPKTVTDLDGIKEILNVDLDTSYNTSIVCTQSFFNALDTMKDAQGRYLLQQDITAPSGYKLLGRNVYIVKDVLLGKAGDQKAFIGDVGAGVFFADRKQTTVQWIDNVIYGQVLALFLRFDVKKADANAGFFVTLDATAE